MITCEKCLFILYSKRSVIWFNLRKADFLLKANYIQAFSQGFRFESSKKNLEQMVGNALHG